MKDSSSSDLVTSAITPLDQLIAKWRQQADKDWHLGHDDVDDGMWAYQHEANGRAKARREDADELSKALAALLSSDRAVHPES